MPLIHSPSKKAFQKNVKVEMNAHPDKKKQDLAIAYSIQRRSKKKMAKGGLADKQNPDEGGMPPSPSDIPRYARGGMVDEAQRKAKASAEYDMNHQDMPYEKSPDKPNAGKSKDENSAEDYLRRNVAPYAKEPRDTRYDADERMGRAFMAEGGEIEGDKEQRDAAESAEYDMEHQGMPYDEHDSDEMYTSDSEDAENFLAEGGEVDQEQLDSADDAEYDMEHQGMPFLADGGEVDPAIGDMMRTAKLHNKRNVVLQQAAKRVIAMAKGGSIDMGEGDDGEVDLSTNSTEQPNSYYPQNEDYVLDDNRGEEIDDMKQPHDSNLSGNPDEDEDNDFDKYAAIKRIKAKMR